MQFGHTLLFIATLAIATALPYSNPIDKRDAVTDFNTTACGADPCAGTNYNKSLVDVYVCRDIRLGPKDLPNTPPLDTLVKAYNRFGGLCRGDFLTKWINHTSPQEKYYRYPEVGGGFQLDDDGKPTDSIVNLEEGFMVDRFGNESGKDLSPAGAPFIERSLPPNALNTLPWEPKYIDGYHLYRVKTPVQGFVGAYCSVVFAAWTGSAVQTVDKCFGPSGCEGPRGGRC